MAGRLFRLSRVYTRLLRRIHPDIDDRSAAEAAAVFEARRRDARLRSRRAWAGVWIRELTALAQGLRHRLGLRWGGPAPLVVRAGLAHQVARDAGFAVRQLVRTPVFTAVAVGSVGVGLAGVLAVFTVANAVLWRTMPVVPEPDRLVAFFYDGNSSSVWSYPDFEDLTRGMSSVSHAAAFSTDLVVMTVPGGAPREILGLRASEGYFPALGVPMALGRPFNDDDPREVVVIGHRLWQREFGGRTDVLGRQIELRGRPHTIVGVAPPGLLSIREPVHLQLYYPIPDEERRQRNRQSLYLIGRMRDDVSIDTVRAELTVSAARLFEANEARAAATSARPRTVRAEAGTRARVEPGDRVAVLGVFAGAVALMTIILIVATTNLANMVLTRGLQRRSEFAVRLALGAGRGRLVRQLVTESLVISVAAGALALFAVDLLARRVSSGPVLAWLPAEIDFSLDWRVVLVGLAGAILAGLAIGLLPALHVTGTNLAAAIKAGAPAGDRKGARLRAGLVTLQLAGSLALVIAAVLFARSLHEAYRVDLGFDPAGVSVMTIDLGNRQYSREAATRFFDRAQEQLAAIPGVAALAFAQTMPLAGMRTLDVGFDVEGFDPPPDDPPSALVNVVSPGYFRLMRMPIIAGREFTADDHDGAPEVVVVSETFVHAYLPDGNAIGRRVGSATIVGVAASSRFSSLGGDLEPLIWRAQAQTGVTRLVAHVRATGDPAVVRRAMEEVVRDQDPGLLIQATDMSDAMRGALLLPTLLSTTFAGAGMLALALASLGVYGIMSYLVGTRRREMGIRLALGASSRQIVGLVLREGLILSAVGFGAGLGLAGGMAFVARSLLVGVGPLDPVSISVGLLVLMAVAATACYLPARRAARLDPLPSLRTE